MAYASRGYTAEQLRGFVREYRGRRRRQIIVGVVLFGLILVAILASGGDTPSAVQLALLVVFLGALVGLVAFSLYNWRCPACRKYLGRRFSYGYCPHCGVPYTEAGVVAAGTQAPTTPRIYCHNCGQPIPTGSAFCNSCGTPQ